MTHTRDELTHLEGAEASKRADRCRQLKIKRMTYTGCAAVSLVLPWSVLLSCTIPIDDWPRRYGTAFCRHEQRCGRVSPEADCALAEFWPPDSVEVSAIRSGLVLYDPGAATACVDLLEKMSCGQFPHERVMQTRECREAFKATLRPRQQCLPSWPLGCESGCLIPIELAATQTEATCGQCGPIAHENEPTPLDSQNCGPGLYAVPNGVSTDGGPLTRVCRRRPGPGEPCEGVTTPCVEWLDCLDSGVCGSRMTTTAGPTPSCSVYGKDACVLPARCGFSGQCEGSLANQQQCLAHGQCASRNCIDGICTALESTTSGCSVAICGPLQRCLNGRCESALLSLCR